MAASEAPCVACGRPIAPRRSHRGAPARYCSKACRARRVGPEGRSLEVAIVTALAERAPGATLCPSEVARAIGGDAWRTRMEDVRRAGRRLAARGELRFLQRGRAVDAARARGPVRFGRGERFGRGPAA